MTRTLYRRIAFRVRTTVTTRGNLHECTAVPFTIYVQPGDTANRFNVAADVANGVVGWSGANSYNRRPLREYAAALSDVDPDSELHFGLTDDGLKTLYYEAVVKGLANGGGNITDLLGTGTEFRFVGKQ